MRFERQIQRRPLCLPNVIASSFHDNSIYRFILMYLPHTLRRFHFREPGRIHARPMRRGSATPVHRHSGGSDGTGLHL